MAAGNVYEERVHPYVPTWPVIPRRYGLSALPAFLILAACAGSDVGGIANDVRMALLGVIDAVAVKGVINEADAAIIGTAVAGDKILDSEWTTKVKTVELPGFLDKVRDRAIDFVAGACIVTHLTAEAAASISVAGAIEGDPVWAGNCSDIIRAGGDE